MAVYDLAVLFERSGEVRNAFAKAGVNCCSVDLQDTLTPGEHYKGDVLEWLKIFYDTPYIIAFPPCQYLTNARSSVPWTSHDLAQRRKAFNLFKFLYNYPCKAICIENPVGYINNNFMKPSQIIHPNYFGDPFQKRTCLWLRGFPKLIHTKPGDLFQPSQFVQPKKGWVNSIPDTKNRSNIRSKTFPGVANAMASQWARIIFNQ